MSLIPLTDHEEVVRQLKEIQIAGDTASRAATTLYNLIAREALRA